MRSFIFALAAIVPAFAIDWARAADEVPEFDIARNCKAETSGAGIEGPAHCTSDETEAKNQLAKRWSSYGASQKKECVGESVIGEREAWTTLCVAHIPTATTAASKSSVKLLGKTNGKAPRHEVAGGRALEVRTEIASPRIAFGENLF